WPQRGAKCGDSLRELEEWSVPGGRDIDGRIRAGSGRADGQAANQTAYWLELLVDGKIVPPDKLSAIRQECDELDRYFCYRPEAIKGNFLVLPSSIYFFRKRDFLILPSSVY